MPYGGKTQLHPPMAMAAKLPVSARPPRCSGMAWGFNPYLTEADPYRRRSYAPWSRAWPSWWRRFPATEMYLTFQEYFEHLRQEPERWGKPLAALLGALDAQMGLGMRRHRRQGLHVRQL